MTRLLSLIALAFRIPRKPSDNCVRTPLLPLMLANGLILAMTFPSYAEDGNCFGFQSLAGNPELSLGRINARSPRTYFVANRAEAGDCPSAAAKCRKPSYLAPGDRVIVSRANGAFACVDFIDAKRIPHPGWLPAGAVDREVTSPPTLTDWSGAWSEIEARIRLKPSSKAGALAISGEATWGGLDPERIKSGAVHIGSIEGVAAPVGASLSFAMGDNDATLPVDQGKDADCKVWMRRLGPYLLVSDNKNCGGANVSFQGVYTRK
jgi:hypothetical protein